MLECAHVIAALVMKVSHIEVSQRITIVSLQSLLIVGFGLVELAGIEVDCPQVHPGAGGTSIEFHGALVRLNGLTDRAALLKLQTSLKPLLGRIPKGPLVPVGSRAWKRQ